MDNLFQNVGLFLCIGGLVVVALVAFAVSAVARKARNNNTLNQTQTPSGTNQRGHERPTYDSQRVDSSGGFGGNVDTTDTNNRPIPQTGRRGGGFGGARQFENDSDATPRRKPDDDDDDNVRSSGGFGS